MMIGSCSFEYAARSARTKERPFMSGSDESTSTRSGGRPRRAGGKQSRPSAPVRALRYLR
jgi:hypothetical protein